MIYFRYKKSAHLHVPCLENNAKLARFSTGLHEVSGIQICIKIVHVGREPGSGLTLVRVLKLEMYPVPAGRMSCLLPGSRDVGRSSQMKHV